MKFGFFGNTNNYPFGLARALLAHGHEVRFVVDCEHGLHRPETRFPEVTVPYPDWILDVGPMMARDILLPTQKNRRIKRWLADCDVLILNQRGPALYYRDNRPKIVILAGSDFHLCREKNHLAAVGGKTSFVSSLIGRYRGILVSRQRVGIAGASLIDYVWPGILQRDDLLFAELEVQDVCRTSFLLVNVDTCSFCPAPGNEKLRIFSGTRLNWELSDASGEISELDSKHADTMLRGLALFIRETGTPLDVRFARKGIHVVESQRLAEELGLTPFITWLDELSQSEVLDEFRAADIILEQLNPKSCFGMAGRDAMAIGRPVIGYANTTALEKIYSCPIPICEASTPNELCSWLRRLGTNKELRERLGREARQFAERFFSADHAAKTCLSTIQRLNA